MTREARNIKLKHLITCMKCEVSGKVCDENCPTQYEAGNMGEIIENLEAISEILEQEPCDMKQRVEKEYLYESLCEDLKKANAEIKRLSEPFEDAISRQAVLDINEHHHGQMPNHVNHEIWKEIKALPSVTPKEKIGYCKDCKWWKDNDGVYRRGIGAESKCPINCKKVYEGDGYCFMFEPQESEVSE